MARETAAFRSAGRGAIADTAIVNKDRPRENARDGAASATKLPSTLRLPWVFETLFLRRER
jgi:hypothetical protein